MVMDRRADHDRGIGDPTGHHNVSTGIQSPGDPKSTQIGIGGECIWETVLCCLRQHIVTIDVGDPWGQAQFPGNLVKLFSQAGRVESTGITDDPDPLVQGGSHAGFQLSQEGFGIAQVGVLHPVLAQDQHGQLSQVVTGQVVEFTTGKHLGHGTDPVAVETTAVANDG